MTLGPRGGRLSFRHLRLAATCLLAAALVACGAPEPGPAPPTASAPAPEGGLVPLPAPSTDRFEPAVREQLERQRAHLAALEAAGAGDADLAHGYGALGMLYHAYQLDPAARACYQNARALAPAEPRWPYYLGELDRAAGRNTKAAEAFAAALKLQPNDLPARVGLGRALQAEGRFEEAERALGSALEAQPGNVLARFHLGQIAAERGDLPAAIAHLEAALATQPEAEPVQRVLAGLYGRAGDRARAAEMSRRGGQAAIAYDDPLMLAVQELAGSGRALADRGVAAFAEGRLADAEAAFRQALATLPEDSDAHLNLGSALFELKRVDEAEAEYRRAVALDPANARARLNLGTLLAAGGRREEAIAEYRAALASEPGNTGAHFNLANSALTLGRFAEAEEHFAAVLGSDPANPGARLGLAVSRAQLGRQAEARQVLEEGLRLRPGDRTLTHGLARLLAASPDAAVRDGARAAALAKQLIGTENQLEHVEALAMALAEQGQFAQAATLQADALEAVRRSQRAELLAPVERTLALYRAGKPCRAPWRGEDFGGKWE